MHIETVRFDDVFDVQARHGDFSFGSRGRTEYGVRLQRHVIPRKGATLAIAFAEPGNWSTVLGWRDLASTQVTLRHPTWWRWCAALGDVALYAPFFIVGALVFGGMAAALAVLAASAGIVLFLMYRALRLNRAVRQGLLAAALESGAMTA